MPARYSLLNVWSSQKWKLFRGGCAALSVVFECCPSSVVSGSDVRLPLFLFISTGYTTYRLCQRGCFIPPFMRNARKCTQKLVGKSDFVALSLSITERLLRGSYSIFFWQLLGHIGNLLFMRLPVVCLFVPLCASLCLFVPACACFYSPVFACVLIIS